MGQGLGSSPSWYGICLGDPGGNDEPMHELSLASEVYRLCRSRVPGAGASRIERVRVAVGELSAVEPDLLRYAWEAVTAAGPDAGASLEIEWRAAIQVCDRCGARPERVGSEWLAACPACGLPLRVDGGRDLEVLEFSHAPIPAESRS